MDSRLERTNKELADFLRRRRESLIPQALGLPGGNRRRTPGLRREEVAVLAGVGLTWYTWLEQGRDIQVSSAVLERIADVLQFDATQRQYLFLLTGQHPLPIPSPRTRTLPGFLHRLLDGIDPRPAHVLNLYWDVLGWNDASDKLFGFSAQSPQTRNMLWMLFTDTELAARFIDWPHQAPAIVASFRRDFALVPEHDEVKALVEALIQASPQFAALWRCHDVHHCGHGQRCFSIEGRPPLVFEHATFLLDEDRSLRLVIYQPLEGDAEALSV